MTATNHAITGALVAVVVKNPVLAIALSFAVHFAMDSIPHFGFSEPDVFSRNSNKQFKRLLIFDFVLCSILLVSLPIALSAQVSWWTTVLSMLACMSPDLVWGYHFYHEVKNKKIKHKTIFSKFHKKIQWSETKRGAVIEVAWFLSVLALIILSMKQ